MKNKTVRIPVGKANISILADPTGDKHPTMNALVKISDLPLDLPLEINPRAQNTESRVARQIQNGLLENASDFHLLNRGLTLVVHDAKYDARSQMLDLELNAHSHGLIDGGHTYKVIAKNVDEFRQSQKSEEGKEPTPEFIENGFVRMEVISGVRGDLLVDIAQSRNTSAQVRDESLANLEGSFDWLKEALDGKHYAGQIAYRENEDDSIFPIDVREIVALATLFHPTFQETEKPPVMAYTSKGRCLELFRQQPEGYKQLQAILPDILRLYDYVHLKFAEIYKDIGGFTAVEDEGKKMTKKGLKLAKVSGVKSFKDGFPLYYLGEKGTYYFPDGWIMPIVAALRAFVSYRNEKAKWKVSPFKMFDKTGKVLVQMTLETAVRTGRNPNSVGKDKSHWIAMHSHEIQAYVKALNVDTEKEITV